MDNKKILKCALISQRMVQLRIEINIFDEISSIEYTESKKLDEMYESKKQELEQLKSSYEKYSLEFRKGELAKMSEKYGHGWSEWPMNDEVTNFIIRKNAIEGAISSDMFSDKI